MRLRPSLFGPVMAFAIYRLPLLGSTELFLTIAGVAGSIHALRALRPGV